MKRRHQVNHDTLPSGRGGGTWRRLRLALAAVAAVGMTGALAMPIVAQGPQDRQGSMPVAIDAINDPSFFSVPVLVDQYAPLAVFGGSGRELAIDGRPVSLLQQETAGVSPGDQQRAGGEQQIGGEQQGGTGQTGGSGGAPLLAGTVGRLGVLPGDLQLMHPVTSRRISSPYGWRKNPTGPGHQIHIGQDYPMACGSPVYAAEAGRVIVSGWRGHSGNRVTIDHGNNVHTGYSHNSRLLVGVGDQVAQGQLIALVGTTGNSTGCHLHFEVLINGRWHDPRNYLPGIPGQPNAEVDSRRLTVKSNEEPGGSDQPNTPPRQQQRDPDVVTPKDDTPVVPKPSPKPKPESKPKPSPSQEKTGKPKPKPSASQDKTGKPKPTVQSPKPTPSQEKTGKPKPSQDAKAPQGQEPSDKTKTPAPGTESPAPKDDTPAPPDPSPTPSVKPPKSSTPAKPDPSPAVEQGETPSAPPADGRPKTGQEPTKPPAKAKLEPKAGSKSEVKEKPAAKPKAKAEVKDEVKPEPEAMEKAEPEVKAKAVAQVRKFTAAKSTEPDAATTAEPDAAKPAAEGDEHVQDQADAAGEPARETQRDER